MTLTGALTALTGCSGGESTEVAEARLLDASTAACRAAAEFERSACVRNCERFPDESTVASCTATCESEVSDSADGCSAVEGVVGLGCEAPSACADAAETCRETASDAYEGCSESCG
ncbi:MAG: hypothetical protein AAF436_12595, partial [Myxococcota bacterium]